MPERPFFSAPGSEHAAASEDEVYTKVDPQTQRQCFYTLHRIGATFHVYLHNENPSGPEDRLLYTGMCFEVEPEAAHAIMLNQGFKWFDQEWWKS